MKKTKKSTYLLVVFLTSTLFYQCDKSTEDVLPVDTTPAYQKAIDAKFASLGWDKDGHAKFNGTGAVKTPSGNGYVQYYAFGSRKTAIYYSESKGTFGMDTNEMTKYDALGGDNFAYVVSDPKPAGTGAAYNEIIKISDNSAGIIITTPNVGVYVLSGEIYKKYLSINLWDGPLGYPLTDILLGNDKAITYAHFAKTGSVETGQIYYSTAIKAQAFWGKVDKLYAAVGWNLSWLGLPIESCDPNKGDANQRVAFQKGSIGVGLDGKCGNYYDATGLSVLQTGGKPAATLPCY